MHSNVPARHTVTTKETEDHVHRQCVCHRYCHYTQFQHTDITF